MIYNQNKENLVEFLLKKKSGAFISLHNFNFTEDENNLAFGELRNKIVNPNIGFRRLLLYFELDNVKYVKKILLFNGIDLKSLIYQGIELNRNSVIYFDDLFFIEVSTNKEIGIGKIMTDFKQFGWDPDSNSKKFIERNFLLKLILESFEGLKCDKQISKIKLVHSYFETYSFNQVAYGKKKPRSEEIQIVLFEE